MSLLLLLGGAGGPATQRGFLTPLAWGGISRAGVVTGVVTDIGAQLMLIGKVPYLQFSRAGSVREMEDA